MGRKKAQPTEEIIKDEEVVEETPQTPEETPEEVVEEADSAEETTEETLEVDAISTKRAEVYNDNTVFAVFTEEFYGPNYLEIATSFAKDRNLSVRDIND